MERGEEVIQELISLVRPGIVRLAFFKGTEQVVSGSGFLSKSHMITCSHVVRRYPFDAVEITFGDQDVNPITPIRYSSDTLIGSMVQESPEGERDFAVIQMDEPELAGRHRCAIGPPVHGAVGERVLFFGFPFGSKHMTSHVGYVSADYWNNGTHVFQIDGSINPGNSGGPLIQIESGIVMGIVTRTETGLEKDFDELVLAVQTNARALEQSKQGARMIIGGVDPVQATQVTMSILARLSMNLKRSANVGIGFVFSSEHILDTGIEV